MTVHSIDGYQETTQLDRIGHLAKEKQATIFNNVGQCINLDSLFEAHRTMDGTKAVGVDGMSKEKYSVELIARLEDLIRRIRRGSYHPQPARIAEIPKEDGSTRPLAMGVTGVPLNGKAEIS